MVEYVRRAHNVLVCTAIIESGLDIPSANTMIVNRADTFGLSQLYQLRGRIGRGRDRAYAYLLMPRAARVTAQAAQRLAVLKRFSDLGAGYQIATHDLELRGAGDLLGVDQSGHIAAVGFELYTELLGEAVERARGESRRHDVEPDIQLPVAAVLPESYVPDPMLRLTFYQRMANAGSDEEIFDVCAEVEDRYGDAPPEVGHLAEVMVVRRRLKALGASSLSAAVDQGRVTMGLTFIAAAPIDREDLVQRCQREPDRYRLLASGRFAITVEAPGSGGTLAFLRAVREQIGQLRASGGFEAAGQEA
jgi:transcription-repair coupling factor (superfamily II helicase)